MTRVIVESYLRPKFGGKGRIKEKVSISFFFTCFYGDVCNVLFNMYMYLGCQELNVVSQVNVTRSSVRLVSDVLWDHTRRVPLSVVIPCRSSLTPSGDSK